MSTVNVKNFPDDLYEKLKRRARRDRRSISQELVYLIEIALQEESPLEISDLRGLGKDVWKEIGSEEHVRRERDSWE